MIRCKFFKWRGLVVLSSFATLFLVHGCSTPSSVELLRQAQSASSDLEKIAYYNEALAATHVELGDLYVKQMEYAKAARLFKMALMFTPENKDISGKLIEAYRNLGKYYANNSGRELEASCAYALAFQNSKDKLDQQWQDRFKDNLNAEKRIQYDQLTANRQWEDSCLGLSKIELFSEYTPILQNDSPSEKIFIWIANFGLVILGFVIIGSICYLIYRLTIRIKERRIDRQMNLRGTTQANLPTVLTSEDIETHILSLLNNNNSSLKIWIDKRIYAITSKVLQNFPTEERVSVIVDEKISTRVTVQDVAAEKLDKTDEEKSAQPRTTIKALSSQPKPSVDELIALWEMFGKQNSEEACKKILIDKWGNKIDVQFYFPSDTESWRLIYIRFWGENYYYALPRYNAEYISESMQEWFDSTQGAQRVAKIKRVISPAITQNFETPDAKGMVEIEQPKR